MSKPSKQFTTGTMCPWQSRNLPAKPRLSRPGYSVLRRPNLPFHRIAEVYFPSMEALEQCAASEGGKQTIGNAVSISSGTHQLNGRREPNRVVQSTVGGQFI